MSQCSTLAFGGCSGRASRRGSAASAFFMAITSRPAAVCMAAALAMRAGCGRRVSSSSVERS
eukprot:5079619-Prymnesium_polylepis.1